MGRKSLPSTGASPANKVFGVRMNSALVKKLKILAVKKDTQVYKLLEEAVTDYLKKNKAI